MCGWVTEGLLFGDAAGVAYGGQRSGECLFGVVLVCWGGLHDEWVVWISWIRW